MCGLLINPGGGTKAGHTTPEPQKNPRGDNCRAVFGVEIVFVYFVKSHPEAVCSFFGSGLGEVQLPESV